MKQKTNWKRIALASLLLLLLLGISGCLAKPDKLEDLPEDSDQVILPFATATPSPSLPPIDITVGGDANVGDGTGTADTSVVPTATIQLITASPSPVPVWTYSPSAATASPTPTDNGTLRNGSTGQSVKNMQQRLKDLGYYTGSVDGDFGAGTESALKAFQKANGLTSDGIAGSRTLTALNSSNAKKASSSSSSSSSDSGMGSAYATARPTPKTYTPSTLGSYRYLQLGSSGSDVKKLQNRLKELGYFNGSVNGNFGEDTEAALIAFQKRNGQYVDGVAGQDTQEALFSSSALPASSGGSIMNRQNDSVPSTGYRTLTIGDSGDAVTSLQARLAELGYYAQKTDGQYGTTTATAVKSFQTINGLTVDGVASVAMQARMYGENALYAPTTEIVSMAGATETLEMGSTGDAVLRLQERLYELGYYSEIIDGVYSESVKAAVSAFQKENKLTVDGKAGKTTQTKIYAETAVKAKTAEGEGAYATLREGDTGERVRALQGLLATYGYYTGAINGLYDAATMAAVQQLQTQNGLTMDGIAGPATQQLLYLSTPKYAAAEAEAPTSTTTYETLKSGASGPDVTMLQQFLQEHGYLDDDADGTFGGSTLLAVQAFQARNGLNPDGVAGDETLTLLYSGQGLVAEGFGQAAVATNIERTTMKEGDEGQDVFTMQERLKVLGYFTGEPDGLYGGATTGAVRMFQSQNGLSADGVAGPATVTAMYAAGAVTAGAATEETPVTAVNNRNRELAEQEATGAIQGSLAGGGVAASYNSNIYYAGRGGTLYRISGSSDKQIFNGSASYIHATDSGVTFLSNNRILRVPTGGGNSEVLASGKSVTKLSVFAGMLYYLDGKTLTKSDTKGTTQTLAEDVNDFVLDVYQYAAYVATPSGVKRIGLNGNGEELITSTGAEQVMLCDSVVFYRSGGSIYRVDNGISVLLVEAEVSWMSIYREMIYYINGEKLYRCDTAGLYNRIFYDEGKVASVSFVSGKAYITDKKDGEVKQIVAVD